MYATRAALHNRNPATTTMSSPSSNAIPPLLQQHRLPPPKGKLRTLHLVFILILVIFLGIGVCLNHYIHLQSLVDKNSRHNNQEKNHLENSRNTDENDASNSNNGDSSSGGDGGNSNSNEIVRPPTLHPQKHVLHNIDVDDNLLHPIPTHFKPHKRVEDARVKNNNNNDNNKNVTSDGKNHLKSGELLPATKNKNSSSSNLHGGGTKKFHHERHLDEHSTNNARYFPFYFPKNRPPQDTMGDNDCDIATVLDKNLKEHRKENLLRMKDKIVEAMNNNNNNNDNDNKYEKKLLEIEKLLSKFSGSTESNLATPCLRLAIFTTIKPCTSEDNIWAQFAAISSWVSIPLHPPPTVVIYDTGLKTELKQRKRKENYNAQKKNDNYKRKNAARGEFQQQEEDEVDEINSAEFDENLHTDPSKLNIFHSNFEESEVVKKFAKEHGITNLEEDDHQQNAQEEDPNGKVDYSKYRLQNQDANTFPPHVTNYSSAQYDSDSIVYKYNPPPQSVRSGSCGWLLMKMIEKFFKEPAKFTKGKKRNGGENDNQDGEVLAKNQQYFFPRVAVVAPTPRLVGKSHQSTLLLGRALHHLTKTVMPALRPLDEGTFDVTSFVNSDIIFEPEKLASILANGVRSLRKFMFVGRRQSLSIDSLRKVLAKGFKKQIESLTAVEGVDIRPNDEKQQLWPGTAFFEMFFPVVDQDQQGDGDNGQQLQKFSLPKILQKDKHGADRIDAEDYFFWTRDFLDRPFFPFSIPPFHIGRPAFDNWLVNNAIHSKQPVVDITYTRLLAIHVEGTKNRNKMSNKDRAYWKGDDADTKENYHLGETHGGWQHGLLEFVPLKMQMISDLERDSGAKKLFGGVTNKKIDNEDVDDLEVLTSELDERRTFHFNKNDVRVAMKRSWKGLGEDFGVDLQNSKNYWKKMRQKYLA